MTETTAPSTPAASRLPRPGPLTVKLLLLAALTLAMLVPLHWVRGVIVERAQLSRAVEAEIGATWGGPQALAGPIVALPFAWQETVEMPNPRSGPGEPDFLEKTEEKSATLFILPAEQVLRAGAETQTRRRGIYEALLYAADIEVEGSFAIPRPETLDLPEGARIDWDEARLLVQVTDLGGSTDASPLTWDGQSLPFDVARRAPTDRDDWIEATLPRLVPGSAGLGYRFSLGLNGSRSLAFIPLGQSSRAELAMDWPHPSFVGSQLPTESEIGTDGFTARWSLSHLARGLSSTLRSDRWGTQALADRIAEGGFGTRLVDPVAFYLKTERAVKYGLLFIVLSYATLVVFEAAGLRQGARADGPATGALHPVQYALVGAALILFFLLLLSLAEVIGFTPAYWLAAGLCLALVALYTAKATASPRSGALLGGALAAIYGYLFVTLRAEDHALLMGSLLLFAMLAAVMYATRNLDWSALGKTAADR